MKFLSFMFATPREAADDAISHAANLAGDAETARVKANFYTAMLLDLDPNKDWWQFAWAKQKQFDAQQDHEALAARVTAAIERAHDRIAPLTCKEEQHEPFTVDAGAFNAGYDRNGSLQCTASQHGTVTPFPKHPKS